MATQHQDEETSSYQSIGVTKDWRRGTAQTQQTLPEKFPINRRHQGLATDYLRASHFGATVFPINRSHQGLATYF